MKYWDLYQFDSPCLVWLLNLNWLIEWIDTWRCMIHYTIFTFSLKAFKVLIAVPVWFDLMLSLWQFLPKLSLAISFFVIILFNNSLGSCLKSLTALQFYRSLMFYTLTGSCLCFKLQGNCMLFILYILDVFLNFCVHSLGISR